MVTVRAGRRTLSSRLGAIARPQSGRGGGVSGTLRAARSGAAGTTGALQALPDTTLIGLAAGSLGVGAGFYLARAPRLAIAAGILPALLTFVAVALRPTRRRDHAAGGAGS